MQLSRKLIAEFIGTFTLVFGGCGSAILAAAFPSFGIGFVGVSFAFGLTVVGMAYAVGHISGGHFNPAVTIGLWTCKRFPSKEILPYIIVQVVGACAAAGTLYLIASGQEGFEKGGFASNGYGEHSPGGYGLASALTIEIVLTFIFLIVILGSTHPNAAQGFAGLPIGLTLVFIHLVSIPVTNTSVNPARSTSQAIIAGGWALEQLWLFWIAPIVGAALAGLVYRWLAPEKAG